MRLSSINVHCMLWYGRRPLKPSTHAEQWTFTAMKEQMVSGEKSHKRHNRVHVLFLESCSLGLFICFSFSLTMLHVRCYLNKQGVAHPQIKRMSLFTHRRVIVNLYVVIWFQWQPVLTPNASNNSLYVFSMLSVRNLWHLDCIEASIFLLS